MHFTQLYVCVYAYLGTTVPLYTIGTQLAVPGQRGVPNSEVDLYTVYVVRTADGVHYREVYLIRSDIYRGVPLYLC